MPITVILGAIACGAALPIAWWALSGERAARGAARDNLTAGRPATTNLRESVPAQSAPAGRFVPARSFAAIDNLPNWKNIAPRFGAESRVRLLRHVRPSSSDR